MGAGEKKYCKFHPTRLAHWFCPFCNIWLCPQCISKREKGGYLKGEYLHLCQKCNHEAEWIGASNLIEPFWLRLHKFFTYPLNLNPLLFMFGLSLTILIIINIATSGGFFRLIICTMLLLSLAGVLLKYSYESLIATGRGDLTPPPINSRTISDNFQQVFKHVGLFIILAVILAYITYKAVTVLGPESGIMISKVSSFIIFNLLLTSMLIILITTNSLILALNPVYFIALPFKIGWGYLLLLVFLFLFGEAPLYLIMYVVKYIPFNKNLYIFCISVIVCYYTIIRYHLMGYVLLQYHEEIGYEIEFEDFTDPAIEKEMKQSQDGDAELLNKVHILVQEGKLDDAITLIQDYTKIAGFKDLALSERYFNLLKIEKRSADLLDHSKTHLNLLAEANQKTKACSLYAGLMSKDPSYTPSPSSLFKIAGWLNESGKVKAAINTFNKLIKAYPEDKLVPKAYFRSAQIFNDRLMQPEQSKRILNGLIKKYPDHDIIPQVRNYISSLSI